METEEADADAGGCMERKLRDAAPDLVVLLFLLGAGISSIPIKQFEYSKACLVDLKINKETCEEIVYRSNGTGHEDEFKQVEQLFTSVESWLEVVRNTLAALLILFTGAFSDKTGKRKIFILLPVIMETVSYLGLLLVEIDFYKSGLLVVGLIRFLSTLSGGTSVLLMAIFSHIGDVTDEKSRTSRIGRLTVAVLACQPLAYLLTLLVVKPGITYPAIFSSLVLFIASATLGFFFIRDTNPKPVIGNPVVAFFKPTGVGQAFKLIFKDRPHNLKKVVLSVIVINILSTASSTGEGKMVYPYLVRRFSLDGMTMAYYFAYSVIVLFIGTAIMVQVLVKKYNLEDYKVGLVGNANKILVNAGYAFVKTPTALYIVTLFDLFTGCTAIGTRSIASKAVESEELGKLFSILGFTELAAPPLLIILYRQIYTITSEKFTGAIFILSYLFIVPVAALFLYIGRIKRNTDENESQIQCNGDGESVQPASIDSPQQTNGAVNETYQDTESDEKFSDIRL